MNKRFLSYMLTVMMALFIFPGSVAAAGSLSNFGEVNQYINGQFTDVASSIWYAPYVEIAYKYGLINGNPPQRLSPTAISPSRRPSNWLHASIAFTAVARPSL